MSDLASMALSRTQVTLPCATNITKHLSRHSARAVRTPGSLKPITRRGDNTETFSITSVGRSTCPARSAGTGSSIMLCAQVFFALSGVGVPDLHSVLEFVTSKACRFCSLRVAQAMKCLQTTFRTACGLTATEQCRTAADSLPNSSETAARQQALARKRASLPSDSSAALQFSASLACCLTASKPTACCLTAFELHGLLCSLVLNSFGALCTLANSFEHFRTPQTPRFKAASPQNRSLQSDEF